MPRASNFMLVNLCSEPTTMEELCLIWPTSHVVSPNHIERVRRVGLTHGSDLNAQVDFLGISSRETARLLEPFNETAGPLETYERERTRMIAATAHELRSPSR